jgi:two-component system cell cycle response regulator DivK
VLLVDDLPETRTTYRAYLESGGLRVEEAGNGAEALTAAAAIRPDVILMDLWMPVLDGWKATRHLKDDPRTRHIPVIAVSGRGLRRAETEARSVGCMMFLEKPCRPEDIIAAIDCALRVQMTDDELFALIDECKTQEGALRVLGSVEAHLSAPMESVERLRGAMQDWTDAAAIDGAVREAVEALEAHPAHAAGRALALLRTMRFATKGRAGGRPWRRSTLRTK